MILDELSGLSYRQWKPAESRASLLLVHGLGAHSARWEFLGHFFTSHNISSYALELRGFGETRDLKGHIDSFNTYLADVKRLAEIIKKENTGKKIFLVGESLGGLIAILAAAREPDLASGLIAISPALLSTLKFSLLDYVKIFSSLLYNPRKQFNVPFNSAMCTRDVNYRKAMDSDEREHRLATSKLLFNTLLAELQCFIVRDKLNLPILFLSAGKDKFVDTAVNLKYFNGLKTADKKLIEYPDMYHALSIDLERGKVFKDMLIWIEKRI